MLHSAKIKWKWNENINSDLNEHARDCKSKFLKIFIQLCSRILKFENCIVKNIPEF